MPSLYDNDDGVRSAFDNRYWPAPYFVDADDIIRGNHLARDATSNRGPSSSICSASSAGSSP
ncbi:hypothetical protein [Streptomyces mirabilis]|uniref:hypothetical protein n=1 Tax=Streptomyces mirabilis TaxID=68239 RepID=UPI0033B3DC92